MNINHFFKRLKYLATFTVVFLSMSVIVGAQSLNFELKNVKLKEVLEKITEQSGYDFVYSDALKSINAKH